MTSSNITYDFIAIGIGPFNLSLACLCDPIKEINALFLDQNPGFDWHPGMMIENTHLQTPFMSDLVTLADPTNPYSFLNYIKKQGRIYSFYIRENFFLLRQEYNHYCQWAASQLSNLRFNTFVESIEFCEPTNCYKVKTRDTHTQRHSIYITKKLVFGTGSTPYLPSCTNNVKNHLIHSSEYLHNKKNFQQKKHITLIGSGQSAAEIYKDLLNDIDIYGYALNWITRSPRFSPLEYTKLTLEMTSPEYIDYFYQLPIEKRDSLLKQQKILYKGINSALINEIFDCLYAKQLAHPIKTQLMTNSELVNAVYQDTTHTLNLSFVQQEINQFFEITTEGLIMATGYQPVIPSFISAIKHKIRWDIKGRYDVNRNYSIDHEGNRLFVQNAELHTHGFVTPDLGMVCYRNSYLIKELTGKEYYPIEKRIAFQQFEATS